MTTKLTGRGGPNRGQGRKPNSSKGLPAGRTEPITIKVSPETLGILIALAAEHDETLSTYCARVLDWHAAMKEGKQQ